MKKIFTYLLLLLAPLAFMAQTSAREKIEAQKAAFITEKLDLSPAEAQTFWPLYNEYQQKKETLRQTQMQGWKKLETMNDKEVEELLNNDLASKQKEVDLQKDFNKKIQAVISHRKLALLYKAEEDFRKLLIQKLKEK